MLPSYRYDHDLDLDDVVLVLKPGCCDSFLCFGRRAPRRGVLLMPGRLTLCVLSLCAGASLVLAVCL